MIFGTRKTAIILLLSLTFWIGVALIPKTTIFRTDILPEIIAAHSPMTWAHINMLGEYDSSDETLKDALGILPLKSAA